MDSGPVKRAAACNCGACRLTVEGEPTLVSVCHCVSCQLRSGSVFATQARFSLDRVAVTGRPKEYVHISDAGERRTYHFCPACGVTLFCDVEGRPETVSIPVGVFGDPSFPPPTLSQWDLRAHSWVVVPHVKRV